MNTIYRPLPYNTHYVNLGHTIGSGAFDIKLYKEP